VPRDSVSLVEGMRLSITIDGGTSRDYQIAHVRDRVKDGGLSHWEAFIRKV
jgi:hypothetical protein